MFQEHPYAFYNFSPFLGTTWHRRLRWKFSAERITEDILLKVTLKGKKDTFNFISRNLLKERSMNIYHQTNLLLLLWNLT